MDIAAYIIVFTVGLLFGSFTNVIIARMPVGESIVFPPSHCPRCEESLKPIDLIPIFSYLYLRGHCRYCKERISPRYPLIEALTALLFLVVYFHYGITTYSLAGWVFIVILLSAAFIDIDHGIIPDKLTYPGVLMGIALSFITIGLLSALYGLLAFAGLLLLVAILSKGGMGGGDIKLAAVIGAFTGVIGSAITLFIASLTGAIYGLIIMRIKGTGRKTPIKFGPFLAVAAFIAYLYAEAILNWYLGLL